MRTKNIITTLLFLFIGLNTQAQFWKKVKDRAKEAAEETVLNKTAEKAAEKTDETMEKIFDLDFGKPVADVDPAILNTTYEYDWRYTLQMQHKKGTMNINYHLRDGATDYASTLEMDQGAQAMGGMLMVMDQAAGVIAILMERNDKKFGQIIASPQEYIEDMVESPESGKYEFKEIGTKKILGYECQGFQIENEESLMTMYLALDTPVSFNQVYSAQNAKQLPKGFDPKWLDKIGSNSLMMEMDFTNKKKPKQSAKMTCVALEEESKMVNMAEYDFPQVAMERQTDE